MYLVEAYGENQWLFVSQTICIGYGAFYLVPETASPTYDKMITLRHLMEVKKSPVDTKLPFSDLLNVKPPQGILVFTCSVTGVLRDSNTLQKSISKH